MMLDRAVAAACVATVAAVLVAGAGSIRLLAADGPSTAGPSAPMAPADCALAGTQAAHPARVVVGEPVSVTLRVAGACASAVRARSDIMLVIDTSGSMAEPATGGGTKLEAARAAAGHFVDAVDFTADRVGVVAFSSEAVLLAGLTADRSTAAAALGSLAAGGGTNIAAGVDEARHVFKNPGHRPGATPVIVVMTDGRDNSGSTIPVLAARLAKTEGARVFTIGFGRDADMPTLGRMASSFGDARFAPSREALVAIYADVARRVSDAVLFTGLALTATLDAALPYVDASGAPRPDKGGGALTWDLSFVPAGAASVVFAVAPTTAGRRPVTAAASGHGIGPGGDRTIVTFPPAWVDVVPAPEVAPTATPLAPCVCAVVRRRAPPGVVADAVANPERYFGWGERLDPGKPPGPSNPPRTCLALQNPSLDYDPRFNTPVWRVGCP